MEAKKSKLPLPFVFALDDSWEQSSIWVDRLKGQVWGFKIGSILYTNEGPRVVDYIKSRSLNVFLDLKFHDIPNTVSGAVKAAFDKGVDWLTVHSLGGSEMLKAAASHQDENHKVLSVTVLTSQDQASLKQIGIQNKLQDQVVRLAKLSYESGIRSIVCSAQEAKLLKAKLPNTCLVTPGVRSEIGAGDQKRTATINEALRSGADYLVIGRELSQAKDWERKWQQIISSTDAMF